MAPLPGKLFTWVKFLRSNDENPEFVIKFLKKVQGALKATVRIIRTHNGTEFINQTLRSYYEDVRITHQTLVTEAVATACYTQNRSLIRTRHNKTPYEMMHDCKPDLRRLHVFGALCYPKNDSEDLGMLKPKADIAISVYSSRLVQNPSSSTPNIPPSNKDWDILFQPLFDEYFNPTPCVVSHMLLAATPLPADTNGIQNAQFDNATLIHNLTLDPSSEESSSRGVISSNLHQLNQSFNNLNKWTNDHPLENVIGNPSRPVSTRSQLQANVIWCYFDAHGHPIPFGGKRSG
ncbi:putative ribonuclease H-like domain-containing protein [Tanacetum coccineum]